MRGPLQLRQIRAEAALAAEFADIEDVRTPHRTPPPRPSSHRTARTVCSQLVGGGARETVALLHRVASERGYDAYIDPASGYSVFTAAFLERRPCCGSGCRHCPYGHANVPKRR